MDKFSILNEKKKNDKKVFLGGTWNDSKWRKKLIKLLNINYFDPIVDEWNEEAIAEEIKQRKMCDYLLYVITPKMKGVYSIAEVVDDSNKKPNKTIFCYLDKEGDKEFDEHQIKSLEQVGKMIEENGGIFYKTLEDVAQFLNK
jgi:hypothetical protein